MADAIDPARHFDAKRAEIYDDIIRKVIPGYDSLHAMARLLLADEMPDGGNLLVVGCGTGEEMVQGGLAHPGWRFTGVEPAPHMLEAARMRVAASGLGDRVSLSEGYVRSLPAEQSFDAATLMLVMHFVPDSDDAEGKAALLAEIAARLKPGAPLILADAHAVPSGPRFERFIAAWRAWQLEKGIPEEDVEKGFRHIVNDIQFVPEERVLELLHGAGFAVVEPFFAAFLFGGWIAWKGRD